MSNLGRELGKLVEVRAVRIPCEERGRIALRLEANTKPAQDMIGAILAALSDS